MVKSAYQRRGGIQDEPGTDLLIMAAGMGSRYGGLKQMDPLGPDGEAIIDYSCFDARRAGFKRVSFPDQA